MEVPVKLLLDERRQPFIPFQTTNTVVVNGSDKTAQDLFNDRYTKEEVDAIINSLGTIQRLCGRVDTYAELPNDPEAGDTWIVGLVTEPNKSEYVWTGTAWEELGPMVDLSGYSTTSEIETMLSSLQGTIETEFGNADTSTLNSAKQYTDDKFSNVPVYTAGNNVSIDSSNVISATDTTYTAGTNISIDSNNVISAAGATYTAGANINIDVNNVISATDTTYSDATQSTAGLMSATDKTKLDTIDPDKLLRYKGHATNASNLPPVGQPSGTLPTGGTYIEPTEGNFTNFINYDIMSTELYNNRSYAESRTYYFELLNANNSSHICLSTDYPEQIKLGAVWCSDPRSYQAYAKLPVYVEYDPDKPVYVSGYNYTGYSINKPYGYYADGSSTNRYSFGSNTWSTPVLISQDSYFVIGALNGSLNGPDCYFYMIDNRYNVPNNGSARLYTNYHGSICHKYSINTWAVERTAIKIKDENYYYTNGMKIFNNGHFVTNTTTNKNNDLWTVGNTNDIYVYNNSSGTWDIWSQSSGDISTKLDKSAVKTVTDTTQGNVYDVTYINTMLGNIETLLGGI